MSHRVVSDGRSLGASDGVCGVSDGALWDE